MRHRRYQASPHSHVRLATSLMHHRRHHASHASASPSTTATHGHALLAMPLSRNQRLLSPQRLNATRSRMPCNTTHASPMLPSLSHTRKPTRQHTTLHYYCNHSPAHTSVHQATLTHHSPYTLSTLTHEH
ncbi:hypothetical protein Pcinc_001994 [Petrolisthes cinctipes]|uniref:Uncharacterized protein n=1 Tax=Petrolisthes cinctipes TaxID=88211 RepID=A0AAE1L3Z2_PETCI|nr:hypothetical protein Pcinc_001994 [Petrolisthes cinctipes]